MDNKIKKRVQKRKNENPTIEMEMQWAHCVAHFGGIYAIQQAGLHTPEDVLHVFTQLAYLRKQRGEQIVQPLPIIHCKTVETIEEETGKMINEKCFEFLQKVIMKNNTLIHSKSAFGGMYTFINNQNIQCCVSPSNSLNLSPKFNTLWLSLLKNVNAVLKAR